jgi:DNA-binding transcriptional ArsR family regulator
MWYGPEAMALADPLQLDNAFHALADANRRAIVARLAAGSASVSELAAPLGVSLPTVMGHLDALQRGGLVRTEKVGRVRTCRLEPGPLHAVEQWVAGHRVDWEHRLDLLGEVLDDAFPHPAGQPNR